MDPERREFRNVIRTGDVEQPLPVDEYMAELDAFIDEHNPYRIIKAKNFEVHAYAETEHGDKALELMRQAMLTADIQRRCRQAVRHTILTNEWRARAMNRWLEG